MTNSQRLTGASAILAIGLAFALAGCAPALDSAEPGGATSPSPTVSPSATPGSGTSGTEKSPEQAASCEWDSPQLPAAAAVAPKGTVGDLAIALIGSWQHTHFDSGTGFEEVSKDIRYVFPSTEQLIYCQHVPGVTDHAENAAAYTLEGSTILPPSPHPGFEALAWSGDSMLWKNNRDGSTYLLVRR